MLRLRWFDPEPDDPSTPVDWRFAALITATLFLNFAFWMDDGANLWMSCSLPLYAVRVVAVALLVTALFFVGPALATQAAKRPLFGVIETSLGSVPAYLLRLCCVSFLLIWLAKLIVWPSWVLMRFVLGREVTLGESGIVAVGILVFVVFTSAQGPRTSAKLALFTDILGLAILIAALIRVHRGWPEALNGSPTTAVYSDSFELWQSFSQLAFRVAPLALFAASFGYRSRGRKAIAMTALTGMCVPLAGTVLLIGVIGVATLRSGFYQPSLTPNVAMALWGRAASSALPGRTLVAAITMFGAMRFGIRALADSAPPPILRCQWSLVPAGCLVGALVCFLHQDEPIPDKLFELLATLLAIVTAVVTVDFVARSWRTNQVRRFDWVGLAAMVAGLAAPWYLPNWTVGADGNPWWHPWFLPSYAITFLAGLLGRSLQRRTFDTRAR